MTGGFENVFHIKQQFLNYLGSKKFDKLGLKLCQAEVELKLTIGISLLDILNPYATFFGQNFDQKLDNHITWVINWSTDFENQKLD